MFGELKGDGLFPIRFLGFGLFWAWLFLTTLSPSPLFGLATCAGGVPFEMFELGVRTLLLVAVVALSRRCATTRGCLGLLGASLVAGVAAVPVGLLAAAWAPTAAACLEAVADVGMFLLWLSFFGYMRLGDTLALLVLSYAAGSLLFLGILPLGRTAAVGAGMLLPALSCAAFVLSRRLQETRTGVPLFESQATRETPSALDKPRLRMTCALGFYSFAFALCSALAVRGGGDAWRGYLVEPVAILVLAGIYLVYIVRFRKTDGPYLLYRAVPVLVGAGLALLALGVPALFACGCVTFGYVMFEMLALNDYCNIVHTENASLLRAMAVARLAISAGMALGWTASYGAALWPTKATGVPALVVSVLFLVVPVATLLFDGRDVALMNTLADDRADAEAGTAGPSKEELLAGFAQAYGLSKRETDVLAYLVEGRTTTYTAEKLVVAESTVRAHVHGIYRKTQVSSRMELLDAFEAYSGQQG